LQIVYGRPSYEFNEPIYSLRVFDSRNGVLLAEGFVKNIRNIIRKKKFSEIKKLLRKNLKVSPPEFFGWLEEEVLPQLNARYKLVIKQYFENKEKQVREKAESFRRELDAILHKPLYYILSFINKYEHIGDSPLLISLALSGVSLLLPRGNRLSIFVGGESGAGKNHAVKSILQLFPVDWFLHRDRNGITRFTSHALEYLQVNNLDKIVYIQENVGKQEGNYTFRVIKSENKIVLYVPVRDESGNIISQRKEIPGDPVIITTSTQIEINPEDRTRTLYAEVDLSEQQTSNVLRFEAATDSLKHLDFVVERIFERERWVNAFNIFFTLLKKNIEKEGIELILHNLADDEFLLLCKKVFPLLRVSVRREAGHIKALAKASAILHYQFREGREVALKDKVAKALIVGWQDWLNAIIAAAESIQQEYGLSQTERDALVKIVDNTEKIGVDTFDQDKEKRVYSEFTALDLAKWINVTNRHANRILNSLLSKGFVELVSEKTRPKRWRYKAILEEIPQNSNVGEYAINIIKYLIDRRAKTGESYEVVKLYNPIDGKDVIIKPSIEPHEYILYRIERLGGRISKQDLKKLCDELNLPFLEFVRDMKKQGIFVIDPATEDLLLIKNDRGDVNYAK